LKAISGKKFARLLEKRDWELKRVKGTRLTVEYLINLLAHGATFAEILEEYEGLTQEDIQACLLFATKSLENVSFMPLSVVGSEFALTKTGRRTKI
jgi:hypothetical protein